MASLERTAPGLGRGGTPYVWLRVAWDSIVHAADMRFRRRSKRPGPSRGGPARRLRESWQRHSLASYLSSTRQDLRYTVRSLRNSPTFTVVVVVIAGLGISLMTLAFTTVNAAFLRPLPHVHAPEELVRVSRELPARPDRRGRLSYEDLRRLQERSTTLTDVVGVRPYLALMLRTGSGLDRQVVGGEVTANYFLGLGIPMALGRGILPEDAGSETDVAVLGYATWSRGFGGDPGVLGRSVHVDGKRYTVVGVAPPGLGWLTAEPVESAVWIPLRARYRVASAGDVLEVAGRRRGQTTMAQVQAELDALVAGVAQTEPERWTNDGRPVALKAMTEREARLDLLGGPRAAASLGIYMVFVGLMMVITCANVASLLLNRGMRRRAEIAMRLALGAGRSRLVRQLVTESVLLFSVAGVLALLLLYWGTGLLATGWGATLPAVATITVDVRVVAFALGVMLACGVVFGLVPALQATRPDLAPALRGKAEGRPPGRFGPRNLFVLAQVAASMVLVAISSLLVRDVQAARRVDIGFDPRGIAVASLDLSQGGFRKEEGRLWLSTLRERMRAIQGVDDVAMATWLPLSGARWRNRVRPEGLDLAPDDAPLIAFNTVTPGYFELVGMPLLSGRDFQDSDDSGAPPTAIVNQAFVHRYWPGQEPVGRRIALGSGGGTPAEVVGVVRDAMHTVTDYRTGEAEPQCWIPMAQDDLDPVQVLVRGSGAPGTLLRRMREEIRMLDEDLPIIELTTMEDVSAAALREQRAAAVLFGGFGVVALFLAALGIYGVMAYAVMERTREMGVRLAVGAHPREVVGMVLADSLRVSALGIGLGLALAALAGMGMRTLLLEVSTLDPASLTASVVVLVLAAILAGLAPALRAARMDPAISLRSD